MSFGHERLDVYRAAIEYVGWAYRFCEGLTGHRNATEQWLRASQAMPLNIAEGRSATKDTHSKGASKDAVPNIVWAQTSP